MATVIAMSSLVARGSVGLRAVRAALHRLGHETIELPTVLLSSHLGYARIAGTPIAPETLRSMIEALDANGWLAGADAILTGYLPSPEHAEVAASLILSARRHNPDMPLFCDPVLGDVPEGFYVPEGVAHAVRDQLVPLATYLKPNAFELGFLSGCSVDTPEDAAVAARRLGRQAVLASSVPAGARALANVLVTAEGSAVATVAYDARAPHGTGDLLTALFAGYVLGEPPAAVSDAAGRAVAGVAQAIAASRGGDELLLSDPTPWHAATPLAFRP
ncbi:MAG TPA: pyridoxal kinase [Hyphomicrobium sp.]|nr:pyridoxal kinase [Hyphomicrobium sp.]